MTDEMQQPEDMPMEGDLSQHQGYTTQIMAQDGDEDDEGEGDE